MAPLQQAQAALQTALEQARQGEQLDHLTKVVDKTATGVERLP